jgi:cytochrome c biogenesis protein CcdA
MKRVSLALLTLLAGLVFSVSAVPTADAQEAVVRFHFFYSDDCADCVAIRDDFLPDLVEQYGDQIQINALNLSDPDALAQMETLEKWRGVMPPLEPTPEIYIADEALIGADEIRNQLPGLIETYLAQGGVELPDLPPPPTDDPQEPVVRFLMFYGQTCPHCHELITDGLPQIFAKYGHQVQARYLETGQGDNGRYFTGLLLRLEVPPDRAGYVPTIVIGDQVLVGGNVLGELRSLIEEYLAQGGVDYPSLEDLPQPVEVLVFFDPTDSDTATSLQNFFTPLIEQHGAWLRVLATDLSQEQGIRMLTDLNAALDLPEPRESTPQVLIGRQMLVGLDEIEGTLPGLIERYRAQGGILLPDLEELTGGAPSATPSPEAGEPDQKPIYVAYFDQAGCQECARTSRDLQRVQEEYPQLVVETFSIEEHKALNEWLGQRYGVPEEKRLSTPMLFIGDEVLIGDEAVLSNLMLTVAKYASTGAARTWEGFDETEAKQSLVERFESFGLLTVLGAGLIDGLNPCAFATLVFFISYLTFTGRRGRDVLFVGASFALGVFLTYLLVGVGLLKAVQSLPFFTALGKWVYLITALLCVGLAVLTFRDFFKARKGQVTEMALSLPMGLRRRIHKVIRESAQLPAFVAVALFTGFVVSLLELACTGQVYLPTILFVLSVPEMAAQAFLYLLLYCLMFIAPLIVVFLLSYFGTTSEQLGQFVSRHTATVKLLTGILFVVLALWMTWTLAPLFGAQAPWNWALMGGVLLAVALAVAAFLILEKPSEKKRRRRRRPA